MSYSNVFQTGETTNIYKNPLVGLNQHFIKMKQNRISEYLSCSKGIFCFVTFYFTYVCVCASVGLQWKIYLPLILTKTLKDTDIVNTHFIDEKIVRPRKIKSLSQDPTTGQQRNQAGIPLTSI